MFSQDGRCLPKMKDALLKMKDGLTLDLGLIAQRIPAAVLHTLLSLHLFRLTLDLGSGCITGISWEDIPVYALNVDNNVLWEFRTRSSLYLTDSETKYIPLVTDPLKNVILAVSQTLILCYDHLLTLDSEINFLWRRPKRISFFLFILLRYFSLLSNIAMTQTLLNFGDVAPERCHAGGIVKKVLLLLQNILVGYILGLRVYAMYSFSKRVLFFLCGAAVVTVILATWSITSETIISVTNVPGCQYAMSKPSAIRMASAWEAQFLCDVVVFGFTVFRSYRQPDKVAGSILDYMMRDGALYFAVFALVNLANILMYYVRSFRPLSASYLSCAADFQLGNPWIRSSLSWFMSTLSTTMVSRLMLNLHKATDVGIVTDESIISSMHFQSQHVIHRDEESNLSREGQIQDSPPVITHARSPRRQPPEG
ncbi:hypothetical protein K438DRAFT_1939394 [Mycena galopus ATCC 62051]|nr:hypothetical protein K438DRAFT_1939394 [Mycena galopus ATCC 62051]